MLWNGHFSTHSEEYAAVAFIRPDVFFNDRFPTDLISELKVRTRLFQKHVCTFRTFRSFQTWCLLDIIEFLFKVFQHLILHILHRLFWKLW